MKAQSFYILFFSTFAEIAHASIRNDDPIERMASGAFKVVVILIIVGAVTFFTKNKKK